MATLLTADADIYTRVERSAISDVDAIAAHTELIRRKVSEIRAAFRAATVAIVGLGAAGGFLALPRGVLGVFLSIALSLLIGVVLKWLVGWGLRILIRRLLNRVSS